MASVEYDVYLSFREPAGAAVASLVEATLVKRGFRVFRAGIAAAHDSRSHEARLAILDRAPDFVVILTPDAVAEYADPRSVSGGELARAVRAERNIVPVYLPGAADAVEGPHAAVLSTYQAITYAPHASRESLARVAHRLTSHATLDERYLSKQTRWMATAIAAVLVVVVVGFAARLLPRVTTIEPLPPIALSTTLFGQRLEGGQWSEFAVRNNAIVRAGDQVRAAFSLNGDGYVYVLAQDSRGDIAVLFPAAAGKGNNGVGGGKAYQAPAGNGWFTIDAASGLQALYVIASYDSLEELESMIDEREDDPTPQDRAAALTATIAGLLDGRRALASGVTRTRTARPILHTAPEPPGGRTTFTTTLSGGVGVTHPLERHVGMVSVMSETRLRFER